MSYRPAPSLSLLAFSSGRSGLTVPIKIGRKWRAVWAVSQKKKEREGTLPERSREERTRIIPEREGTRVPTVDRGDDGGEFPFG